MTSEALVAANILTEEGIDVRLIHLHTIKPIDEDILRKAALKTELKAEIVKSDFYALDLAVISVSAKSVPQIILDQKSLPFAYRFRPKVLVKN